MLRWTTPGDTTVGDATGADMDLHLVQGEAPFNDPTLDCHYNNRTTGWGATLERDDTDGEGPEQITLQSPADTTYHIYAHYFGDHGMGPSDATIEVYIAGALAYTQTHVGLATGELWDIGILDWATRTVTSIDTVGPVP